LSFREFLRFKNEDPKKDFAYTRQRYKIKKLLDEYLEFGGFPEVVLTRDNNFKQKILKEYYDLLIYRDLAERFSLENTDLLQEILKYLFTNITSLFSVNAYYRSIKQTMSVSRETIYEYIARIKEVGFFLLLPNFSYSLKEQKVNPVKIIALDNGLRNKIAFQFSKDLGKLAENLVGNILLRRQEDIFYWHNKKEVDFIISDRGILKAVNVSFGPVIEQREIDSLNECLTKFKKAREAVVITKDIDKKEGKITYIPLYKWLLEE
jgi:predicted AAA+ superfamily ATPase